MSLQPGAVSQGSVWRLLWSVKHWKKLICRIVYSRSETELSGAVRCLRTFISRANLKDIGEETFYFCAANELQLPKKVEFIGRRAFCKWTFLEQVSLPESVQYIGDGAFRGCNRLKVLEIRHEPEYLGELITNRNVTIRCKKDSKVETYAKEFGYPIEYIE